MMQRRPVGRSGVELSVVGFGTAQLQMIPERQAIDTLLRGFELGVNWVHTAPDYGGVDPWIEAAIRESGRDIEVLTAGPAETRHLEAFFENACHVYRRERLALYGISGIEDIEYFGENVWGPGGMVEILERKKAEGRLGGIYCSTHGGADDAERLIESGVFDAVMVAWNPLGFHQQSHQFTRNAIGRAYEDLADYEQRIFPLAARRGVGLLVMKPFAGGLLCRGKAFPPHAWYSGQTEGPDPADVLRTILAKPGVCAVLPGCASVDEAEENALAGHGPLEVPGERSRTVEAVAAAMRMSLCSRCGACLGTCSNGLQIPALFRDAYIWGLRNETVMSNPAENYFDLHPGEVPTCLTCDDRTCVCPQGIDIPASLVEVHRSMQALRAARRHPGPSIEAEARTFDGPYRVRVHTADVPAVLPRRGRGIARFLLENAGEETWLAEQHAVDPSAALGIGLSIGRRPLTVLPLRNSVGPHAQISLAFEFRGPGRTGEHDLEITLLPLHRPDRGTVFHSSVLKVERRRGPSRTTAGR